MPRPTQEQYDLALALYRANRSSERIATAADMDLDDVERMIDDGWPARGGQKPVAAMPSLSSQLEDRVIRLRNAELDFADQIASTAARVTTTRAKTIELAAAAEQTLMRVWYEKIKKEIDDAATESRGVDLTKIAVGQEMHSAFRTLRSMRDQTLDLRAADLFKMLRGEDGDGDSARGSELEAAVSTVAGLTAEQKDEYIRTGKLPKKQLELQLVATE
jgi:hypothetical protein